MLDKKVVFECVEMLCENFSLDLNTQDMQKKCRLLYPLLLKNGVTDEHMRAAVVAFMERTKGSNFNKLPSIGDFLDIMGKSPVSVEDKARSECVKAFNAPVRWKSRVLFDDPITNYVIDNEFCGIYEFSAEQRSLERDNKSDEWMRKRFVEAYLNAYATGGLKNTPLISNSKEPDLDKKVFVVGDEEKAKAMLLEYKEPVRDEKVGALIQNLTTNMKG